MSEKIYVYKISAIAALGGLLFGYDTAVISGTTEAIQSRFELNDIVLGWVVSSALIGCIAGVLIAGWFSDTYGRKKSLALAGLLFAVSSIGSAFPMNADLLILARLIGGIGVGIASMVTPMYIAEIAPPNIRGALVSINQIAIVLGMVLAYSVNRFIVGMGDGLWLTTTGWRWMLGIEALPALVFFWLTTYIAESPRWLAKKEQFSNARMVINKITRSDQVESTYDNVIKSLHEEEGKIGELFRPKAAKITVMTMILALFQAITGINIVMYYAPRIFLSAGLGTGDAYGHSIIIGLIMVLFTVLSVFLVDKVGRRPLMLTASLGMGISLLLMGIAFSGASENSALLLTYTLIYVSCFSIGMGGIYWVLISEIFPNRIRGRAMALSVVFLWTGNFLVAQFFPTMLTLLQEKVFIVFSVVCFICFVFIFFCVPETKNRSLEELESKYFQKEPQN